MQEHSLYFPKLVRRPQYSSRNKYSDYRPEIREDCQERCVYCDTHENVLGGMEAMQIEHYHPQSLFPDRKNDPLNLLWVCNRCNCLKRDDWHPIDLSDVHNCKKGYLDPFTVDRSEFFVVEPDGVLTPIGGPAPYMIQHLKLNRAFLIYVRRSRKSLQIFASRVEKYFEDVKEYNRELLSRQSISEKEYDKQIKKADAMKKAVLEFIQFCGDIFGVR